MVVNILSNNKTRELNGFTIYTFQNVELTIWLDTAIYNAYRNKTIESVQQKQILPLGKFQEFPQQDFYSGEDGIIVGFGQNWRDLISTNDK